MCDLKVFEIVDLPDTFRSICPVFHNKPVIPTTALWGTTALTPIMQLYQGMSQSPKFIYFLLIETCVYVCVCARARVCLHTVQFKGKRMRNFLQNSNHKLTYSKETTTVPTDVKYYSFSNQLFLKLFFNITRLYTKWACVLQKYQCLERQKKVDDLFQIKRD